MKTFIALMLLTLTLPQTPTTVSDTSNLEITQFSYTTKLIERDHLVSQVVSMQAPVLDRRTIKLPDRSPDEKNNPLLTVQRDSSQRKQELDSLSSSSVPRGLPEIKVTVFAFQAQMKNNGPNPITRFVWAYRSSATPPDFVDQQYLCNVRIEPGKTKPVKLISPIPRRRVVTVSASGTPPAPMNPSRQDLIINQLQYADGSTWQRHDWNGTILLTRVGARKLKSGKCIAL